MWATLLEHTMMLVGGDEEADRLRMNI